MDVSDDAGEAAKPDPAAEEKTESYPWLGMARTVFGFLAVLAACGGVVFGLAQAYSKGPLRGLLILSGSLLAAFLFAAAAQMVSLLFDVQRSLKGLAARSPPHAESPEPSPFGGDLDSR